MPINVKVCTGVTCSIRGSREILAALERMQRENRQLDVRPQNCFARCEENEDLCPCVRINDDWIEAAEAADIKSRLRELIQQLPEEEENDDPLARYLR